MNEQVLWHYELEPRRYPFDRRDDPRQPLCGADSQFMTRTRADVDCPDCLRTLKGLDIGGVFKVAV